MAGGLKYRLLGLAVQFDNRPLFCPVPISQSANTKYINNQTVKLCYCLVAKLQI
jgi:hypothetical protein